MEFLKEFFHFLCTGTSRKFNIDIAGKVAEEDLANAEAAHASLVRNVDEIIDSQPIPNAPPPPPFINYEAKLDLPQHKPVYILSPAQFERLQVSAKIGDVAWSIPQARPGDDKELASGLETMNQEIADLKGLGLVKDVSEHFKGKIATAMKLFGRHVRYYAPTRYTVAMFQPELVREGDHDIRKERTIQ